MEILLAPEVLFWPVEGPPGRSKPSLNGGHKCQLCLEPSHYHLFHIPPSSFSSSPANNTVTHTWSPKMSSYTDKRKTYEALTSSTHCLTWTETTWASMPCSRAVNPDSCRQCCLVPTGMTGIQALNVTMFLCWLQQRRQAGGKVTSPQPLQHALVSQGLLRLC